jgi:hypothetical protein
MSTPVTLAQGHELIPRVMPAPTAPASEWLTFRRSSAAMYRRLADVDRRHHHEALHWAELETAAAEELADQIAAEQRAARERATPSAAPSGEDSGDDPRQPSHDVAGRDRPRRDGSVAYPGRPSRVSLTIR